MITTKQVNVNLTRGKLKLRRITTKDIDVGIRVEPPKTPIKTKSITTTTLQDVADIAEKKRRDDIMKERKLAIKDKKKIMITKKPKFVEPSKELIVELKKKPWKEMIDAEKKVEMKRRAVKAKATRARKKKEKENK